MGGHDASFSPFIAGGHWCAAHPRQRARADGGPHGPPRARALLCHRPLACQQPRDGLLLCAVQGAQRGACARRVGQPAGGSAWRVAHIYCTLLQAMHGLLSTRPHSDFPPSHCRRARRCRAMRPLPPPRRRQSSRAAVVWGSRSRPRWLRVRGPTAAPVPTPRSGTGGWTSASQRCRRATSRSTSRARSRRRAPACSREPCAAPRPSLLEATAIPAVCLPLEHQHSQSQFPVFLPVS